MRCGDDMPDCRFEVIQDIACGNTQNVHPAALEKGISPHIPLGTITAVMRLAIDFDDKSSGRTVKIGNETAEWMLLAKFAALRSSA